MKHRASLLIMLFLSIIPFVLCSCGLNLPKEYLLKDISVLMDDIVGKDQKDAVTTIEDKLSIKLEQKDVDKANDQYTYIYQASESISVNDVLINTIEMVSDGKNGPVTTIKLISEEITSYEAEQYYQNYNDLLSQVYDKEAETAAVDTPFVDKNNQEPFFYSTSYSTETDNMIYVQYTNENSFCSFWVMCAGKSNDSE